MPNFTYTTNLPAASHNPSADQPIMQINANSINSIIAVDHFSFNDNNGGLHKKVSLVNNAGPFTTPGGAGSVMYSTGNQWVFSNASLAGAGVVMTNSAAPPIDLPGGSTFLPGGFVMEWGSGVTTAGVFGTLTQNLIYPLSTLYCVIANAQSSGDIITNTACNGIQITVNAKSLTGAVPATTVYWLVIGKL